MLLDEISIDTMELQAMIFNDLIKRVQKCRSSKRIYLRREPKRKKKKEEYVIHGLGGTPRIRGGVSKVGKRGREKDRDAPVWSERFVTAWLPFPLYTHRPSIRV